VNRREFRATLQKASLIAELSAAMYPFVSRRVKSIRGRPLIAAWKSLPETGPE